MSISIRLESKRAIVRWHCPLCGGETWKQSVRVAVYEDGVFAGAVCPGCLNDSRVRHSVPELPTFAEFWAALQADAVTDRVEWRDDLPVIDRDPRRGYPDIVETVQ